MSWNAYGADHDLVLHENVFGERYRVLIVNADDFDNDECFDIQEQADHYFDDRYVDDISDYGSYAGRKYMVDFEKGELSDEICLELSVTQL